MYEIIIENINYRLQDEIFIIFGIIFSGSLYCCIESFERSLYIKYICVGLFFYVLPSMQLCRRYLLGMSCSMCGTCTPPVYHTTHLRRIIDDGPAFVTPLQVLHVANNQTFHRLRLRLRHFYCDSIHLLHDENTLLYSRQKR